MKLLGIAFRFAAGVAAIIIVWLSFFDRESIQSPSAKSVPDKDPVHHNDSPFNDRSINNLKYRAPEIDAPSRLRLIADLKINLRRIMQGPITGGMAGPQLEELLSQVIQAPLARTEKQSLLWEMALEQSEQIKKNIIYDMLERIGSETIIPRVLEYLNTASIEDRTRVISLLDRSLEVSDISNPIIRESLERNTILISSALDRFLRSGSPGNPDYKIALNVIPEIMPKDHANTLFAALLSDKKITKSEYNLGMVKIYTSEENALNGISQEILPTLSQDSIDNRLAANRMLFEYINVSTDYSALQNPQLKEYIESQRPENQYQNDANHAQWMYDYGVWIDALIAVNGSISDPLTISTLNAIDRAVMIVDNESTLNKHSDQQLSALLAQLEEAAANNPKDTIAQLIIDDAIRIVSLKSRR